MKSGRGKGNWNVVEERETGKWKREGKLESGRGKGNWKVNEERK